MDKNEIDALAQLRRGEPREFTRLMLGCGDRLLRAAFMLCRDETLARDLVQDTFFRALTAAKNFRGDSCMYTWLYAILRHQCRDHQRRLKRRAAREESGAYPRGGPVSESGWEKFHHQDLLLRALDTLPRRQREVVLLRFVEEMKLAEIAVVLKVPQGTVKSRLHHAVAALRRRLLPPATLEKNHELQRVPLTD